MARCRLAPCQHTCGRLAELALASKHQLDRCPLCSDERTQLRHHARFEKGQYLEQPPCAPAPHLGWHGCNETRAANGDPTDHRCLVRNYLQSIWPTKKVVGFAADELARNWCAAELTVTSLLAKQFATQYARVRAGSARASDAVGAAPTMAAPAQGPECLRAVSVSLRRSAAVGRQSCNKGKHHSTRRRRRLGGPGSALGLRFLSLRRSYETPFLGEPCYGGSDMSVAWPNIPYQPWRDTCSALHLYLQIVGKYRLARTPWINHPWHATFYVNARGFTTSLVLDGPGGIEIIFDLLDHVVAGAATDGRSADFPLKPMSVADFHKRFLDLVRSLGGTPGFDLATHNTPKASLLMLRKASKGVSDPAQSGPKKLAV